MHELGITLEIIDIASRHAAGRTVKRIVLQIGKLSAVLPDAVRFCFDACSLDSPLKGAQLEIVEMPGVARCRACGREVELSSPWGRCSCGESDLEWLSGEDLRITELEVV